MNSVVRLLILLVIAYQTTGCAQFVNIHSLDTQLIDTREMRFCYISFVRVDGKMFLVKQKKVVRKILGCVRDAITAYVAQNLGIAHRVAIIPAGMKFPGKVYDDLPATIHTIAPGKMIKEQKHLFKKMNLQQRDTGFTRSMIAWMGRHSIFADLLALDTFVCNHDRHRGNLFFNEKTGLFCAIDMDSSYKYNLCKWACSNFMSMMDGNLYPLSSAEFKALIQYKKRLINLVNTYSPEKLIEVYNGFAQEAGFVPSSPLYTKKVHDELGENRVMIRESYKDVKKLIRILNVVIKRAVKQERV